MRMELNELKVDLDIRAEETAKKEMKKRLAFLHDLGLLKQKYVDQVYILKKTKWSAKVILNIDLAKDKIILLQLLLGSDYRKEGHTIVNIEHFGMEYSNRMFDIKRYPSGKYVFGKKKNITLQVRRFINSSDRKRDVLN